MKMQWIVVVAAVIVLCLAGCSGTGGVGGQGITITADNTSHIEHVSITITDGGTGLGNPSAGLRASPSAASTTEPEAETQTETPPHTDKQTESAELSPASP